MGPLIGVEPPSDADFKKVEKAADQLLNVSRPTKIRITISPLWVVTPLLVAVFYFLF